MVLPYLLGSGSRLVAEGAHSVEDHTTAEKSSRPQMVAFPAPSSLDRTCHVIQTHAVGLGLGFYPGLGSESIGSVWPAAQPGFALLTLLV